MATCITKARSNYFSVTDVPAFLTIMQKWEKDFGIRIGNSETCAACKCKRHCEDFVMPNSTRCKCNFMDHLRRKRWRRIRRIFR